MDAILDQGSAVIHVSPVLVLQSNTKKFNNFH